jgi:hypothetical protein
VAVMNGVEGAPHEANSPLPGHELAV